MNDADNTIEKTATRSFFPELDTGASMLAYYLRQYIQNIRQLEKRPTAATAAR